MEAKAEQGKHKPDDNCKLYRFWDKIQCGSNWGSSTLIHLASHRIVHIVMYKVCLKAVGTTHSFKECCAFKLRFMFLCNTCFKTWKLSATLTESACANTHFLWRWASRKGNRMSDTVFQAACALHLAFTAQSLKSWEKRPRALTASTAARMPGKRALDPDGRCWSCVGHQSLC